MLNFRLLQIPQPFTYSKNLQITLKKSQHMGNLWYTYGPYVAHKWETYGSVMLTSGKPIVHWVVLVPICLPICGKPMGNKPILLPSMGNLWNKKPILHLNLPIGFLQLRDFCHPKMQYFVIHRFSMYAWVTYGEKEINEIMSTHMIPRCFPQIFHIWKTYGILYNRWLFLFNSTHA